MTVATMRSCYTGFRLNWLYRTILLSFSIMEIAEALTVEQLAVTADYPKGCKGGPGPAKGGDGIEVLQGTCIFKSVGMDIGTNIPGKTGVMTVQFNVVPDGPPGPWQLYKATVNISGSANLNFEKDGISVQWNPGDRTSYFEGKLAERVDVETPSKVFVDFPGGEEASNEHYSIEGWADSQRMILHSNDTAKTSSSEISLFTGQTVFVETL
ncbi:hypothetical protein FOZ61_000396 [Perkinsus olseni]|uniref:Protein arginine methyltransferase 10 n=1 Tax=Perkinsus olseni TaxID=32597 RepID=A0A7J6KVK7_PEROL|nr:hypothetical protein FOZ61_000396 [Perkinsus olseni]KAF4651355.1 hypothetical protein FOL46_000357 [Perkinsus olseni]